jgi:hypothetical protein
MRKPAPASNVTTVGMFLSECSVELVMPLLQCVRYPERPSARLISARQRPGEVCIGGG